MGVCRRPPWREQSISAPAMVGSTTKYRSGLWIVLSLTSCILSVSLAKSEARYRGYSGYRRNYNPGYFRGYRSSYGRSDYHHQVQQHHQHSGPRKYGYKIVAPSVSHIEAEQDRFIPAPVNPASCLQASILILTWPVNNKCRLSRLTRLILKRTTLLLLPHHSQPGYRSHSP